MEESKEAIHHFTNKTGHHTNVDEIVNAAITREIIKPTRHETTTEAIDREVHQHHYHTTVQPITHREVLPERHHHQMMPVDKREFHHGDHDAVKHRVSTELGQFSNHSITHEVHHTRAVAPAVTGEHVHHHVHETVQPVIHKETIQPEVIHTTIPIHEIHHAEATHHTMSALPMKTLEEFTRAGGLLRGSERHTHEEYEGAPRPYNKDLQTTTEKILNLLPGHHSHHSSDHREARHDGVHTTTNTTTSTTGPSTVVSKGLAKRDSGVGEREEVRLH